ncbi:MAG: alkaline phosphatase family protein [Nocardioides sp.]
MSKQKLSLFKRSWDSAIDRQLIRTDNRTLVTALRRDLVKKARAFTLLHLSLPDVVGHASGFMGPEYHDAVAATDARLGLILRTIDNHPKLTKHLAVIVVADHGGRGPRHYNPTKLANYRIPFLVWGPGVAVGQSLYALNPDYQDPGKTRPTYGAAKQPVRNADAANLALDLLGLPAVPGSKMDAAQDLDVLAP